MSRKEHLKYQFKHLLIRRVAYPILRALFNSCRWEIEGLDALLASCKKGPVIITIWHESLLITPYLLRHYLSEIAISALISKSRDGKLVESLKDRFANVDTIQVAHDSRHVTMRLMSKALDAGRTLLLTPDGPQGPWKKVKRGMLQVAYLSKANLWSLNWCEENKTQRSQLRLPTPDRMRLPLPFQTVRVRCECLGIIEQKQALASYQQALEKALG